MFFHLQMLQRQILILQMCLWFYLSHPVTSITCVTLGSPDIPLTRPYPALGGWGATILSPVDHFQKCSLWYAADRSRKAGHARLQLAFPPVRPLHSFWWMFFVHGAETVLLLLQRQKESLIIAVIRYPAETNVMKNKTQNANLVWVLSITQGI